MTDSYSKILKFLHGWDPTFLSTLTSKNPFKIESQTVYISNQHIKVWNFNTLNDLTTTYNSLINYLKSNKYKKKITSMYFENNLIVVKHCYVNKILSNNTEQSLKFWVFVLIIQNFHKVTIFNVEYMVKLWKTFNRTTYQFIWESKKNARTEIQTHERQIRNKQQSTMKSDQLKTAIVLRDTNHAMHNLRHVT